MALDIFGLGLEVFETLKRSGAHSLTLTTTATTDVTFPTTGTLATLAGTEELDNKTLDTTVAKGTWTASGTWTIPAVTLGGTVTGGNRTINALAHIGLGNTAASATYGALHGETFTITDNAEYGSFLGAVWGQKTSAAFTAYLTGFYSAPNLAAGNTQNWTRATVGLSGFHSAIRTRAGASGTLTGVAALLADTPIISDGASDAIITNYYGAYLGATSLVGNSRLVNCYGIYIGNQTGGGTLNYAIYTNGGLNHFVGNVNTVDVYSVDGTQVVSNQGAAVNDATDAASAITQLNALIARCRAHGLIAT